ncbi:HET-domain-containing protein [Cadophora sp. DSE1049]|nr:HET-domain-containing protein [Cadophora sp. DSE1049]
MWLLDTSSLALHSFMGDDVPSYAILSHTWGKEEVSFQDILSLQNPVNQTFDFRGAQAQQLVLDIKNRAGYHKIVWCCAQALKDGHEYAWVDTCCIDKTNSAELSEAINSMFKWYQSAAECYAYLEDIEPGSDLSLLGESRWFTRGWTLQELIAPSSVIFFDRLWVKIGDKTTFSEVIELQTGIPSDVLLDFGEVFMEYSIAQVMSWASKRCTTRGEDRAYSLLGLFQVSMPMLYGEGSVQAFRRLQLEITKTSIDHSIFAWVGNGGFQSMEGPFARSPDAFSTCGDIVTDTEAHNLSYEMTNLGLRMKLLISDDMSQKLPLVMHEDRSSNFRWAGLNCMRINGGQAVGIWLSELTLHKHHKATGQYMRTSSRELHIGAENIPLNLTEIYLIEANQQVMSGLGAFRRRQEVQIDKPCSIDLAGMRHLTYRLQHVEGWVLKDSSQLADTGDLIHVRIPSIGRGTLLFKNAVNDKFGLVLDLKADCMTWALTYSFPSSKDEVETDIEYVQHMIENEPDQQGGLLNYGDWATGYFMSGYNLSLKVDHSIISGKLGFAMQIKSLATRRRSRR